MSKARYNGKASIGNLKITVSLDVIEFKEEDTFFAFSPALDITGYGRNAIEARKSFEVMVEEFCKYTIHKGTIKKELSRLGWRLQGSKRDSVYIQPTFRKLIQKNEQLADIVEHKEFQKIREEIQLPAFA